MELIKKTLLIAIKIQVQPGHTVLIHAAAGGTGSLLCQWANALGATVIGTVSTEAKAEQAKSDGCHHIILYKHEDFVSRVNEITSGKGVDVVYDSVGKDTFEVTEIIHSINHTDFVSRILKTKIDTFRVH